MSEKNLCTGKRHTVQKQQKGKIGQDSPKKFNNDQNAQSEKNTQNTLGGRGKKVKYVNFYTKDHKPGLIKGRHPCNCEATKHELINNCTKCGRIVCEQEGSGPCFFCDNMVSTSKYNKTINIMSNVQFKIKRNEISSNYRG